MATPEPSADRPGQRLGPVAHRVVRLHVVKNGQALRLAFLRLAALVGHLSAGDTVHLDIFELQVKGPATVMGVDPCPPLEEGAGRLVTWTAVSDSVEVLRVKLAGLAEPLEVTGNHPVFSEDHQDFVSAKVLRPGDRLRMADRAGTVVDAVERLDLQAVSKMINVKVQLADKTIRDYTVEASHAPPWKLTFSGIDADRREFDGDDLFEAMIGLRKELEGLGCMLLCAGARADVFPSGMSRSMAGGRKAYVTRFGMPAGRSDMVDIFDYAEPDSVGTVEHQREFHQKWISSQGGQTQAAKPLPGEVEEAKRNPNGWVYRIAGRFAPSEAVPPEAIIGAWKVDPQGNIVGAFIKNPKYDPKRWPASPT